MSCDYHYRKHWKGLACLAAIFWVAAMSPLSAIAQDDKAQDPSSPKPTAPAEKSSGTQQQDPFADVTAAPQSEPAPTSTSWKQTFTENLGFRKEIMSQFDAGGDGNGASRQSVGFEVLKKFS